ncbi:unnamed protein product [Tuber melanosporum]|uniref:(Perigord truffle) hypothetical protein n=1 Tax=Tuber melanosporum (strain Mel28) TaxID=656061 RepID=D5GBT2_TUBMM|nr:uncharacterized protein GSTUM_00005568001 [Tuber melanosporum]CAZ81932.1 unnamed protein product [Tuber melanosporum]
MSDHPCAQRYDVQTHHPSYEPRSECFSAASKCLEKQAPLPTFHPHHKVVDVFNYQTLHEALQTLDEPPSGEYESEKGTPLPAYGSIAHHYQQQEFTPPPCQYQYGMPITPQPLPPPPPFSHDPSAYNFIQPAYPPAPAYGSLSPNYGSMYTAYGLSLAYTQQQQNQQHQYQHQQPPVYGSNGVCAAAAYGYNPLYAQPLYSQLQLQLQHYQQQHSPTFIPAPYGSPPSYGFTNYILQTTPPCSSSPTSSSPGSAPAAKPYHEYGDCGETLPLPAMVSATKLLGGGEIRSLAVFTSVFRNMPYITKDGPIAGMKLKDPCLNCKALMQTIPSEISILAGTGSGCALDWIVEKAASASTTCTTATTTTAPSTSVPPMVGSAPTPQGYNLILSTAYSATKPDIYHLLETWTLNNTTPTLPEHQKASLRTLWREFILPFRDRNQIFRLDNGDNVDPSMHTLNSVALPICTVFCAIAYVFSVVLRPEASQLTCPPSASGAGGEEEDGRDGFYLPLLAVLGKWCSTICPWAHPNVVNVAYSSPPPTSPTTDGMDTHFVIGTSKPSVQAGFPSEAVKSKHQGQMRTWRRIFLEGRFGALKNPCPVKIAGMAAGVSGGGVGTGVVGKKGFI